MKPYVALIMMAFLLLTNCNTKHPAVNNVVYVKGAKIYTANHEQLIMRGVNEMFIWSNDLTGDTIIPEIAKTNSNTLRIVWLTDAENPNATPENLDKIIQNSVDAGMFPMPELHGATGKWDKLQDQVDYWTRPDVVEVLKKHERYLLLNIANECGGHEIEAETFRKGYQIAIDRIRATGLRCPLVIDASGWGQDLEVLLETGPGLLKHDPLSNLIFSVHMWWVAEDGSAQRIIEGIERSIKMDLPLIIGEFAPMGVNCARHIDYETIMEQSHKHEIGWLAWSWGAVGNGDCAEMDMTRGELRGMYDGLTDWGLEVAVTHPYSIQNTSIKPLLE